jgi:hypothetical protein
MDGQQLSFRGEAEKPFFHLVENARFLSVVSFCENSAGALRLGSGRTVKYLSSLDPNPFVLSVVEA